MTNKRRQFSSCEACRKSRLGCNARTRDRGQPCSNCARRGIQCVVQRRKDPSKYAGENTSDTSNLSNIPLSGPTQVANHRTVREALDAILLRTFSTIFESRFSHILQSGSCPAFPVSRPATGSIITLVHSLDEEKPLKGKNRKNEALTAAIRAFAFNFFIASNNPAQEYERSRSRACHNSIWAETIRLAAHAMKDRSYQSALALSIIGLASFSVDVPHKPKEFHTECFETASRHMTRLQKARALSEANGRGQENDIAYWCIALTENACQVNESQRTSQESLFSQRNEIWTIVRDRTYLFHQSFKTLHGTRDPMSKEVISAILQHATMHKCMTWWDFNTMKDSTEIEFDQDLQTAARDMLRFREVFLPLLDLVGRDFLLLNPKDQLSYVLVTVHFHWAVMLFINEIEKRSHDTPIRDLFSKSEACRSIISTLGQAQLIYETSCYQPAVLLLDPMFETMVSCVRSAADSVLELYDSGSFSLGTCRAMLSVTLASLKVLCKISQNARVVLNDLATKSVKRSIFKSEVDVVGTRKNDGDCGTF